MRFALRLMQSLSLACCGGQPTRPLLDGRIGIEGCTLRPFRLPLAEILRRAYGGAEFDLAELGLGSYVQCAAGGRCPYVAIPAYPLRSFRHRDVYVRADRIAAPADLEGKRVGLVDYGMTAAVVLRGLLRDSFGVDTGAIGWVVDGIESPFGVQPNSPADAAVEAAPEGETLDQLLAAGAIDALIALAPPPCFAAGHPDVARLFPDYRKAEAASFAASGVFPIMHVIAMRRELANRPGLAQAVYTGFLAAKNRAMDDLGVTQAPKLTLPWLAAAYEESVAVLGADYWSYGVSRNRSQLDRFLADAHSDGLTPDRLGIGDVFHPDTLDT